MRSDVFHIFEHDLKLRQVCNRHFFAPGDILPLHKHDGWGHACIVQKGTLEIFFEDGSTKLLPEGSYIPQITPGKEHGFRAITEAILLNIGEAGT